MELPNVPKVDQIKGARRIDNEERRFTPPARLSLQAFRGEIQRPTKAFLDCLDPILGIWRELEGIEGVNISLRKRGKRTACWKSTEARFNERGINGVARQDRNSALVSRNKLELTVIQVFVDVENVRSEGEVEVALVTGFKKSVEGDNARMAKIEIADGDTNTGSQSLLGFNEHIGLKKIDIAIRKILWTGIQHGVTVLPRVRQGTACRNDRVEKSAPQT